jgi:hypothetical protein
MLIRQGSRNLTVSVLYRQNQSYIEDHPTGGQQCRPNPPFSHVSASLAAMGQGCLSTTRPAHRSASNQVNTTSPTSHPDQKTPSSCHRATDETRRSTRAPHNRTDTAIEPVHPGLQLSDDSIGWWPCFGSQNMSGEPSREPSQEP